MAVTSNQWDNPASYRESWNFRAALVGQRIPRGSRVLDLGCGPQMALKQFLPPDCVYSPVDQIQWHEAVFRANFDTGDFPAGEFDYAVILGVIEYLREPAVLLRHARRAARQLIASYCHPKGADPEFRLKRNWINAFSENDFAELIAKEGWRETQLHPLNENANIRQLLHCCE